MADQKDFASPSAQMSEALKAAEAEGAQQGSGTQPSMRPQTQESLRARRPASTSSSSSSSSTVQNPPSRSHRTTEPTTPSSSSSSRQAQGVVQFTATPKLTRPLIFQEVGTAMWAPTLTEMWVQFSQEEAPEYGWHRQGTSPYLDAFFGCGGTFRHITRERLAQYCLNQYPPHTATAPPRGVTLHYTLIHQIPSILKTKDYLRDTASSVKCPIMNKQD